MISGEKNKGSQANDATHFIDLVRHIIQNVLLSPNEVPETATPKSPICFRRKERSRPSSVRISSEKGESMNRTNQDDRTPPPAIRQRSPVICRSHRASARERMGRTEKKNWG